MTDKQLRQAIINPTQVLVSDGVNVESNLGYFNLGATGRDLLATATQAEAQSVIGATGGSAVNRLINGGMAVDQRNEGAAQTLTAGAALAYTVDRWYAYCTGANVTGQRVQGATAGRFRYQFTGAASVTAIGFGQRIEQLNSADLAGTTATLSVDLANSLLTSVTWTAYYANTANTFGTLASPTRTQIATGTFTVNSTVTRYSTQIAIPIEAVTGIEIVFTVGAQTSGTWEIGNVQLESGSVATPFEVRILQDRYLCLQYYETGLFTSYLDLFQSGANRGTSVAFSMAKRVTPSVSWSLITQISDPGTVNLWIWDAFRFALVQSVSRPTPLVIGGTYTASAEL